MFLLLLIGVCFLWEHARIKHLEEAPPQWSSLDLPGGVFLSGSRPLGWRKALATVAASSSPKTLLLLVPLVFLLGEKTVFSLGECVWSQVVFKLLNMVVTNEEPTSGHHDVCSVDTPKGDSGRNTGVLCLCLLL